MAENKDSDKLEVTNCDLHDNSKVAECDLKGCSKITIFDLLMMRSQIVTSKDVGL